MNRKNIENLQIFRKVFFVFSFFMLTLKIFAVDFGGLLTNNSSIKSYGSGDFKLDQKNSALLWFRTPFDKSGELHSPSQFACRQQYFCTY